MQFATQAQVRTDRSSQTADHSLGTAKLQDKACRVVSCRPFRSLSCVYISLICTLTEKQVRIKIEDARLPINVWGQLNCRTRCLQELFCETSSQNWETQAPSRNGRYKLPVMPFGRQQKCRPKCLQELFCETSSKKVGDTSS